MAEQACVCLNNHHDMLLPPLIGDVNGDGVQRSSAEIHVLAVDDSVIDRKVIENLLKVSALKVTAVDSGSKALDFLGLGVGGSPGAANINISMIITDYCMPGMSGFELLKCIKESSTLREIPVVVMSSENVPTRIESCLAEGAEEFIMKPVQLADVNRLKDYIRQFKLKSLEASMTSCNKRKLASEDQSPSRRTRLSGVVVA